MFRLGIAEIILFLVIFFLVDPKGFPKIFRRLGKLSGKLRKMQKDVNVFIDPETGKGRHEGQKIHNPNTNPPDDERQTMDAEWKFENDVSNEIKLLTIRSLQREYDFTATSSVIRLLFDSSPEVRSKAAELLFTDPVFGFNKRLGSRTEIRQEKDKRSAIEELFSPERVDSFTEIISDTPLKYFKGGAGHLAAYPGIDNLDLNKIFSGSRRELYNEFQKNRNKMAIMKFPPQITISPSYSCNMSCPYCFVKDTEKKFPEEMGLDKFREILDISDPERKLKKVSLFGGEPTIFGGIQLFIDEVEKRNMTFYFSTNGQADPQLFRDIIDRECIDSVTFHIEQDDFYTKEQLERLMINFEAAVERKVKTFLRYNIQETGITDWHFFEKYFSPEPWLELSFSVVFPGREKKNSYIEIEQLKNYKTNILSLVDYFVNRPFTVRCRPVFAKPYPLCFFNREELYFILKNSRVKNICEIDRNGATNNLIVHPDGSFSPCMALISEDYTFPSLSSVNNLPSSYYSKVSDIQKVPLLPECRKCSLHYRGLCQAACYAYI